MKKFNPFSVDVKTAIPGISDTFEISGGLLIAGGLGTEPTAVVAVNADGYPFNPITQGEKLADWIFENLPSDTAKAARNRLTQRFIRERGQS